jgi:hypothetical protein
MIAVILYSFVIRGIFSFGGDSRSEFPAERLICHPGRAPILSSWQSAYFVILSEAEGSLH